ncbi:hypothetical protein [Herbiconiux sp.]|uniref:hypothetical protein n=1 Tax=Herbiconiux sp. TaxID=1871186 RepID=UPI0025C49173|nr:hypothetical protein [Herbiconiux sp.]
MSDARELAARGVDLVGVWDVDDPQRRDALAAELGVPVATRLEALFDREHELVIGTVRTPRVPQLVRAVPAASFLFLNKTIAAGERAFRALEAEWRPERMATASVLRFAPAVRELAERVRLSGAVVQSVSATARHDIAAFLTPERAWQDSPSGAGGTLVNVGVHAWELVAAVLGDDPVSITSASLWPDPRGSLSEGGGRATAVTENGVRVAVDVSGAPAPDRYTVSVRTAVGHHEVVLDAEAPGADLGFGAVMDAVLAWVCGGPHPASWPLTRVVYDAALSAAAVARSAVPA